MLLTRCAVIFLISVALLGVEARADLNYRIKTGGPSFTDSNGNAWTGETNENGDPLYATDQLNPYLNWGPECNTDPGSCRTKTLPAEERQCSGDEIRATIDDKLYLTERYDSQKLPEMVYGFPVDVVGMYRVRLHFAEVFWGLRNKRVFNVAIEGQRVLDHYDIASAVGFCTADTHAFEVQVTDGELEIAFGHICPGCPNEICGCFDNSTNPPALFPSLDNPKISAIEIAFINPGPSITNGATVSIEVNESSTCADASNTTSFSATDPSGNNAQLAWSIKTPPQSGNLTFVNGVVQGGSAAACYVPTHGFFGADSYVIRVVNPSGGVDEVLVRVNVMEIPAPVLTCPLDATIIEGASTSTASLGSATAADPFDASPQISFADSTVAGVCPQAQVLTRTWSALNKYGKVRTCDQTIVVKDSDSDGDGIADCQETSGGNNPGGNNPGGSPGGQVTPGSAACCGGSIMMALPATMLGWTWIRRRGKSQPRSPKP